LKEKNEIKNENKNLDIKTDKTDKDGNLYFLNIIYFIKNIATRILLF